MINRNVQIIYGYLYDGLILFVMVLVGGLVQLEDVVGWVSIGVL